MNQTQPGILHPVPLQGRYLCAGCGPPALLGGAARPGRRQGHVIGLGYSLILALDVEIDGLRVFPALVGRGIELPSIPAAL